VSDGDSGESARALVGFFSVSSHSSSPPLIVIILYRNLRRRLWYGNVIIISYAEEECSSLARNYYLSQDISQLRLTAEKCKLARLKQKVKKAVMTSITAKNLSDSSNFKLLVEDVCKQSSCCLAEPRPMISCSCSYLP
jgi:hypothetical protein